MGDLQFIDTMIRDGLWDAFNGYHMGTTAENVATEWQIKPRRTGQIRGRLQNKAEAARKAGKFKDEITAVTVKGRKGDTSSTPMNISGRAPTYESMSGLRPLSSKDGTVTAGNASGLNDGAPRWS